MADTSQDESQSNSRSRDASLPIEELSESNPRNSPASFKNKASRLYSISDPYNQDKRTGYMYKGGIKIVHWYCEDAIESLQLLNMPFRRMVVIFYCCKTPVLLA